MNKVNDLFQYSNVTVLPEARIFWYDWAIGRDGCCFNKAKPGLRLVMPLIWVRAQSVRGSSSAEDWHNGDIMIRFLSVKPRRFRVGKTLGIEAPLA